MNKSSIARTLSICAIALLLPLAAQAATRYVATTGSDSGSCTTESSPCRTLSYCVSKMGNGDTCQLAAGSYSGMTISNKNCSGCVLRSEAPQAARLTSKLEFNNSNGWTAEGFEFGSSSNGEGICIWTYSSDNLVFRDIHCWHNDDDNRAKLFFNSSDDIMLDRVRVDQQISTQCTSEKILESYSISAKNVQGFTLQDSFLGHNNQIIGFTNVNDVTIRRNVFEHFWEHGVGFVDGQNVLIENNIWKGDPRQICIDQIQDNGGSSSRGIDIYCGKDITVRNNTFAGHDYAWRNPWSHYGSGAECDATEDECTGGMGGNPGRCAHVNYKFYNNLLYDTYGSSNGQFTQLFRDTATNFKVDGNIYHNGPGYQLPGNSGRIFECDVDDFGPTEWAQYQSANCWGTGSSPTEPNSVFDGTEPTFANYSGEDYRPLNASSTQVNSGVNGTDGDGIPRCSANDFNGFARTDGQCDIGAFELGSSGGGGDDGGDPGPPPPVQNTHRTDTQGG